jgi:hypothetical protein
LVPCGSLIGMFHCILVADSEYVNLSVNKTPHAAMFHFSALRVLVLLLDNMIILHFIDHVGHFLNLLMKHNWISFLVAIYGLL